MFGSRRRFWISVFTQEELLDFTWVLPSQIFLSSGWVGSIPHSLIRSSENHVRIFIFLPLNISDACSYMCEFMSVLTTQSF